MPTRLIPILCLISTSASAQFFSLATPAEGSRVYFATALRQRNTPQPGYGKLFRVDSTGLILQESRIFEPPAPLPPGINGTGMYTVSNAYDIQAVDVSSDGGILAASARRDRNGEARVCTKIPEKYLTTITSAARSRDFPGNLRLSANGQWAFGAGSGIPSLTPYFVYQVNLATGEQIVLTSQDIRGGAQISTNGRPIANNGVAVYCNGDVVIRQGTEVRHIATPGLIPADAVIDAAGRIVVYSANEPPAAESSLFVVDVATGATSLLVSGGYAPSLSDDGSSVVYLSRRDGAAQIRIISIDGSGDRALTEEPYGVLRAILSGDGSTAFAVTVTGSLVKISTITGEQKELIPRTPFLDGQPAAAPGKLITITGAGLSDSAITGDAPLPYDLAGIRIRIDGTPARISSVTPGAITILTPLQASPREYQTTATVQFEAVSPSPFAEAESRVRLFNAVPEFLRLERFYMLAAHEDWDGWVTADAPSRPGELLHAFAAGLGATSPSVAYGDAAPASQPFARLTREFSCRAGDNDRPVEILFAGLAPALVGIYQIDWLVPADAPDGTFELNCPDMPGAVPVRR